MMKYYRFFSSTITLMKSNYKKKFNGNRCSNLHKKNILLHKFRMIRTYTNIGFKCIKIKINIFIIIIGKMKKIYGGELGACSVIVS